MAQDWIQTFTGKAFCFGNIREDVIDIKDIAHALALTNRFGGHTEMPYSVAQHSVMVALELPDEYKLQGLLHDAHEAYVGDNTRAFKRFVPGIKDLEKQIDEVIYQKFNIGRTPESDAAVKHADDLLLYSEACQLLPGGCGWASEWALPDDRIIPLAAWSWIGAELRFLKMFRELTGERA